MKKKEFYYDSADGVTKIHGIEWIPEGKPMCILQIVHGMAEYINRYAGGLSCGKRNSCNR